ncbi:MAG: hypothetical protein IJ524_08730 [Bacteroidales bacterium]|nr:hypothetical protein [Bacteroidales bacterium]
METVCQGKQWDVLLSNGHGRLDGAMPYLYGKKLGLKYILQPQLTPWSGPWLHPDLDFDGRFYTLKALAHALHALHPALCMQCFSPEITDSQPFQWEGFRQTTRYTFRFPSLADPEALYRSASRLRRRYDKAVAEECVVDEQLSLDEFVPFHVDYYRRRGQNDLIAEPLLRRVVDTACRRGQGLLWGLRSQRDGSLQAAWFVAYDERCAWSLLLAIADNAPHGAMSYLMWQMLRRLSSLTQSFDFEGGMDESLAFFYRSFGTVQTPYHCIYRSCLPFAERLLHV